MDHFAYRTAGCSPRTSPLETIADAVGTPVYVYATATLRRHYRVFADALAALSPTICYAVKANGNIGVVATLAREGAGADVVSGGELTTALAAGVPAARIVFSGVGKTAEEMAAALRAGILQINVESEPELELLDQRRAEPRRTSARRHCGSIRTSMPIPTTRSRPAGAKTSSASSGRQRTASTPARRRCRASIWPALPCTSARSSPTSAPFREAFRRVRDLVAMLRADGLSIRTLDLGGGLGIPLWQRGNGGAAAGWSTRAPSPRRSATSAAG